MTKADLIALAERVERAGVTMQRELLVEAFSIICPCPPRSWKPVPIQAAILDPRHKSAIQAVTAWRQSEARFIRMLNAKAYESAAMTLVPPQPWRLATLAYYPPVNFQRKNGWFVNLSSDVPPFPEGWRHVDTVVVYAATPSLALTAASLRAIAEEMDG